MKGELFERYPKLKSSKAEIEKAIELIIDCYKNYGKLLLCGNGGSSSDCEHISGELMKGFLKKRPLSESQKEEMKEKCHQLEDETLSLLQSGLPAISLPSLTALLTAFSNDVTPELSYAQAVLSLGRKGDILIAISTSGNAENVVSAAKIAKGVGMTVIGLTGKDGDKLKDFSDVAIIVDERETFKIQELHLPTYHYICSEVEEYFFEV